MKEPLTPVYVPGVHAYAEKSVEAGGVINFRISISRDDSDDSNEPVAYQLSVLRPGLDLQGRQLVGESLQIAPITDQLETPQQPVRPGSYVHVNNALPAEQALSALTLECWVRPAQLIGGPDSDQWWGLISQYSHPNMCGFGMFLGSGGRVALYLGDGQGFDNDRLLGWAQSQLISQFEWAHLVGVWDGTQATLWINGQKQGTTSLSGPVIPGAAPLRLAAYGEDECTAHILEGDLAMPVIYGRALSDVEIQERYAAKALQTPNPDSVLACWPLTEEKGETVADISPAQRTGTLINQGTWMIGGPSFDAEAVARFGEYDPTQDPTRGHALGFSSDDLYDAEWSITKTLTLPSDLKPGIYIGRINYGPNFQSSYDVTFVVKKPRSSPTRKQMVVLCATNTWLAYSCTPFISNYTGSTPPVWGNDGRYDNRASSRTDPPAFTPGYNFYRNHQFGQPTYLQGLNLPWPAANPNVRYFGDTLDYSHLVRAELFTHVWLEQNHYDYDVITDFDLHEDPSILDGYKVLLIAGHSEYWSIPAYQRVEKFLQDGHDVIALSGNTMFWRVSFDPALRVMQCRKAGYLPGGRDGANTGQIWHSGEERRGGLMRECGFPTWRVLGMESAGLWNDTVLKEYTCDQPGHELFQSPIKVFDDDKNDDSPLLLAAEAVGHEWDVSVSLCQQSGVSWPLPQGSAPFQPDLPARIQTLGHSPTYWCERDLNGQGQESYTIWDYFIREADPSNKNNSGKLYGALRSSEIIYWTRTRGGRVFYAGSVAAGRALWGGRTPEGEPSSNAPWQNLLRNVLAKFEVTQNDAVARAARLPPVG